MYKPYEAAHLAFGEPETPGAIAEGKFFGKGVLDGAEWAMFRENGVYVVRDVFDLNYVFSQGDDPKSALDVQPADWDIDRWLVSEDSTFSFIHEDLWDSALFEEALKDEFDPELERAIRKYQEMFEQ